MSWSRSAHLSSSFQYLPASCLLALAPSVSSFMIISCYSWFSPSHENPLALTSPPFYLTPKLILSTNKTLCILSTKGPLNKQTKLYVSFISYWCNVYTLLLLIISYLYHGLYINPTPSRKELSALILPLWWRLRT